MVLNYFGIRVFNKLRSTIKDLSYDVKQFKLALKCFFLLNPCIVWRNMLIGDKLPFLVLYYSALNRALKYTLLLTATILQIPIFL